MYSTRNKRKKNDKKAPRLKYKQYQYIDCNKKKKRKLYNITL